MSEAAENLARARRYLRAIEEGTVGAVLEQLFAPEVVFEILPSRLLPEGTRHGLAEARAGAERGKKLMAKQSYEVTNEITNGDWVVLEVRWTGTLAVAFQTLPAGGQLRARFAAFLQFKNGKIVTQRNYDCYEPW